MPVSRKAVAQAAAAGLILLILLSQIQGVGAGTTADPLAEGDKAVLQGRAQYGAAVRHYTDALGTLPPNQQWKAYYKRAEVYQLLKRYEEAVADLSEWIRLKPNKGAYMARIKVNTLLGNFGNVAADYSQLMTVDTARAAEHQAKAVEFNTVAAQYEHIRAQLEAVRTGVVTDDAVLLHVYRNCVTGLGPIQEYAKENPTLALLRAECAIAMSDHNVARAELNRVLEKNPNSLQALHLKARSLNRMGAVDAARTHIRKCLAIDQEFEGCVQLHKQIKAYEKLKKAVEEFREGRQWAEALAAIDEAFAVDPNGPESNAFWRYRCEFYYHLRQVEKGLQACATVIDMEGDNNPGLLDVYLQRADFHLLRDDLDAASRDIEKARELDPRSPKVREKDQNLARLRKISERKDYYRILGVPKTASEKEIKAAYRKLALQWHPDKTQDLSGEERERAQVLFRDIAEAKEVLCDEEKRGKYDRGEDLNPQQQQQHGHHFHFPGQHFQFHFG